MNELSFWQFAEDSIKQKNKIVLLTVADSSNSSPGRQGFKMLVREDKTTKGTIGGGIMEKRMIDHSFDIITGKSKEFIKRLQHSNKTQREPSGLICGGFQTIIFKLLNEDQLEKIKKIIENLKKRKNGVIKITMNNFDYDQSNSLNEEIIFNYKNETDYEYKENIGFTDTAYIIGGGHVGLAVSRIMKSIGFYVVVFDHREEVFTMDQNSYADEKIISGYNEIREHIKEGSKSYVIIVTPAHSGDKVALASVLNMNLKYIGMMGSKRKVKTIFNELKSEGHSEELLKRIHSPIGLEIEAESPEEIAISIAAQIIKVKRSNV